MSEHIFFTSCLKIKMTKISAVIKGNGLRGKYVWTVFFIQQTDYLINWKYMKGSYYVQDWCTGKLGREYASSFKVYPQKLVSYRNQSIVTLLKSIDWFLYDKQFLLKGISEQTRIIFFHWMLLLLTLNAFKVLGEKFKCWLWTSTCF